MGQLGLNTAQYTHSNMKFLVLSALVAVSSCQLVAYHNGAVVPADTPAVAAAKLAHANAGGVVNLEGVLAHGYAAGYPYGYAGYFEDLSDMPTVPWFLLTSLMFLLPVLNTWLLRLRL